MDHHIIVFLIILIATATPLACNTEFRSLIQAAPATVRWTFFLIASLMLGGHFCYYIKGPQSEPVRYTFPFVAWRMYSVAKPIAPVGYQVRVQHVDKSTSAFVSPPQGTPLGRYYMQRWNSLLQKAQRSKKTSASDAKQLSDAVINDLKTTANRYTINLGLPKATSAQLISLTCGPDLKVEEKELLSVQLN